MPGLFRVPGLFRARAHCVGAGAGVGWRGLTAWARARSGAGSLRGRGGGWVGAGGVAGIVGAWSQPELPTKLHSVAMGDSPGTLAVRYALNPPASKPGVCLMEDWLPMGPSTFHWRRRRSPNGGFAAGPSQPNRQPPNRPRRTVPAEPSSPNRPRRIVTTETSHTRVRDGRVGIAGSATVFSHTLPCVAEARGNRRPGARLLERRGRPPHFAVNTIGISTQTGTSRVRFFAGAKRMTRATSSAASSSAG